MDNQASIKEIFKDDKEAIEWLNSIDNNSFKNILNVLYKYAKGCLRELGQKDLSKGIDEKGKREIIEKVIQYITEQKDFREKCLINSFNSNISTNEEFRLGIFSEEELSYIEKLTKEDVERLASKDIEGNPEQTEFISKIRKANRFYNMQLKLAHTARIVKVADEILKTFGENFSPDLKEVIITSALLHDIGRFYQAKENDTFADGKLKLSKEEYGSGHSKAGYYYSMMDLFRMNFSSNTVDRDLLIRTIAGFVVSYHSENNIKLEENGIAIGEECLKDFEMNGEALEQLIRKAYLNAEFIEFNDGDLGQKQFIEKFMHEMALTKGVDTIEALGIDQERICKITENMTVVFDGCFIRNANKLFRENSIEQDGYSYIDELVEKINLAVNIGENNILNKTDIKRALINMTDYDVAKSIYEMFKEKGGIEEERIKGALFTLPLNIVMDADKIDILNQLASGKYPFTYNSNKYKLFEKDDEFVEFEKEDAFKMFFDGKKDIIINQSDVENFYKYNGLKREDNISPVRSTLWLLNQFIFTNMRNKGSLLCVKDNRFIEKTYQQFSEDENIQKILKPYMAYTLYFLDNIIQREDNLLTPDIMKQQCEELLARYKEDENIRAEYEELFDGDILENREEFLATKKKIITVNEIGNAVKELLTTRGGLNEEYKEINNGQAR